jgi:tape measure domain-containing protein
MSDTTTIFDLVIRIQNENSAFNRVTQSANQAFNQIEKRASMTGNIIKGMIAGFGVQTGIQAIGGLIKSSLQLGATLQSNRIAFQTMLQDPKAGDALFKKIQQMGAATPFESKDLIGQAQIMLQYGQAASSIIPNLNMLGDISMGNAEKLKGLTYAFSQIGAAGRLQGQDLRQLIDAGFNPLKVISDKTGRSMAQLKTDMEKGKISFDMVKDAMVTATSKGGMFYQAMQAQSQTLGGLWSTLVDNFDQFRAALMDAGTGAMTSFINVAISLTGWLQKNADVILKFLGIMIKVVSVIAAYKAMLFLTNKAMLLYNIIMKAGGVATYFMETATIAANAAFKVLNNTIKFSAIGVAIALLGTLAAAFIKGKNAAKDLSGQVDDGLDENIRKYLDAGEGFEKWKARQEKRDPLTGMITQVASLAEDFTVAQKVTEEFRQTILKIDKTKVQVLDEKFSEKVADYQRILQNFDIAKPKPVEAKDIADRKSIEAMLTQYKARLAIVKNEMKKLNIESKITPSSAMNDLSTELSTQRNIKQMTVNIGTIKAAETIEMNNIQEGSKDVERAMIDAVLKSTSAFALQNQ